MIGAPATASRFALVPLLATNLLAAAMAPAPAGAQRGNPELRHDGQSIDDMIAEFMRDHEVPGISLAIVQAPYVTRAAGYGLSDPATRTLASPNTLFRIDGLARAYTGVAVIQLVEAGKLGLDEPVAARLPGAPQGLTVRQLLGRRPTAEDASLLRRLVAAASGQTYEAFVREGQIDRLGLAHTFFASELARVRHEAIGAGGKHRAFLHERALVDPTEPAAGSAGAATAAPEGMLHSAATAAPEGMLHRAATAAPEGTLYASAPDVSLWDIALAGELLIRDPALRKVLYAPPRNADGSAGATSGAWDFPGHPGLMVVAGSGGGFSSLLSRFTDPSELVCVTLLANRDDVDLSQLARRIAGAYDPKLGPPARANGSRVQQSPYSAAETRQRFASAFAEPLPGLEVWEENGEVWIAAPAGAPPPEPPTDRAALLRRRSAIDAALLQAVSP